MTGFHSKRIMWPLLPGIVASLTLCHQTQAESQVVIWDTGTRFTDTLNSDHRADWKIVPSQLFAFEADPVKAASDPGYYGREYEFKGDAVLENRNLLMVVWSARGCVALFSKAGAGIPAGGARPDTTLGMEILEFAPRQTNAVPGAISRCEVLRNSGDEVALELFAAGNESSGASLICSLDKSEILEVRPGALISGIRLECPIEYGVVPGFVGDDLIFGPAEFDGADALCLPAENVFVGLLQGGDRELVMTWPKGKQHLRLHPAASAKDPGAMASMDFDNDGLGIYMAGLNAPGLWHREALKPAFLEKEVALAWKPPFPAKWKTQLTESGVRTTFNFQDTKGQIWRGVAGSYDYPVWFDDGRAFYHLSKKVPPKGESIVYFLEGQDTPYTFSTPVDIIKATLGRPLSDAILDVPGRRLRTHHRRGEANVHRACTCGCTEAIQAVFEAGQEVSKRDDVEQALEDMNFFVRRHVERIGEYRQFAGDLIPFLQAQAVATPELKPFCDHLSEIAQRIPQEYRVQEENMKSLAHADELTRQTMALTSVKRDDNLKAYMALLDAWRAMGGAQDYVLAQCHTIARDLFQQAGYGCVGDSQAVVLAREVRARCRQVLRNPDGYEIWADY